jgi:hypothetical protein
MPDARSVMWEEKYQKAITQTDKGQLEQLILEAEQALFLRAQQLQNSSDHREERLAMDAASAALIAIKVYKLGWPKIK